MNDFQEQLDRLETILKEKNEKPLTFQEACLYTGLSKSYVYKLSSKGEIPHFKPNGKKLFFLKADLNGWLLRNRIESNEAIEQKAVNHITGKGAKI